MGIRIGVKAPICSECGEKLKFVESGLFYIEVEPCQKCLAFAIDNGREYSGEDH